MLCPRAKDKGKNRAPYLARKEKFRLYEFLVYNHFSCLIQLQYQKRVLFWRWGVQPLWPGLLHARLINCFLVSLKLQGPTSKASTMTPKNSIQKGGLTPQKKNPSGKRVYGCITNHQRNPSPLPKLVCPGHSSLEKIGGVLLQ